MRQGKKRIRENVRRGMNRILAADRLKVIVLGYAVLILLGAALLCLPFASRSGSPTPFTDALFTATTSVCVTGLVVYDTFTHWSVFGQVVILCLVQVGGLSFMVMATLFSLMIRRTVTLKERMLIVESLNQNNLQGVVRLTRDILRMTLTAEGVGALLLWPCFIRRFGWPDALGKSVFHSVSAFCNAGLDLMGGAGEFSSFTAYTGSLAVNLILTALIIAGGLGFSVWEDIGRARRLRQLSLHSKIVLTVSAFLLVGGTLGFFLTEYHNPATVGNCGTGEKLLAAWFQSVSTRTAGFNTIPLDGMTTGGKALSVFLMFIGGSPGSTAGGIKTVTFGVLAAATLSVLRGDRDVNLFHRRISTALIMRAIAGVVLGICACLAGILIISFCEPGLNTSAIVYEAVSAFATVGQTLGITPQLSVGSKLTLIVLMLLGRVGILTATLAFTTKMNRQGINYAYPEEKIML